MNKVILTHLAHLSQKADNQYQPTVLKYKPVSPFCTNKMKKITEQMKPNEAAMLIESLKNDFII